jgi:hypothetical protein
VAEIWRAVAFRRLDERVPAKMSEERPRIREIRRMTRISSMRVNPARLPGERGRRFR